MFGSAVQRRVLGAITAVVCVLGIAILAATFSNRVNASNEVSVEVLAQTTVVPTTSTTTTTTVSTTTTASTTTTTIPLRETTLAFTGDTLAHSGVVAQANANARRDEAPAGAEYDFAPMFELVEPYLSTADVAICHLETPLSPDNTDLSGYPTFNVPREMADALVGAGYDGCTFASNHSLDRRPEGVADSLGVLDDVGLLHSGAARDQAEFTEPTIYDANGIAVASLSYSYGFNGFTEPADTPWLVNEIDLDEIAVEAMAARDAGAEYVVLSVHWGTEYRHDPSEFQLEHAQLFAELDVDLIIGHHAHVVQPVTEVHGVPTVYGLGNFLSNQSANCCAVGSQDGMIMQVHLHELATGGFETFLTYVPTRVDRSDFTIVPVVDALADPELASLPDEELQASRDRTSEVVYRLGQDDVGRTESRLASMNPTWVKNVWTWPS